MNRTEEIFVEALDLDPSRRDEFLAAYDTPLRQEVRRMLNIHDGAGDFLERPAVRASREDAWVGKTVNGRYRIDALLGRGGMSTVYIAADLQLAGRSVVLKFLHDWASRFDAIRRRVHGEMKALARIHHPGVVGVLNYGEAENGVPYLVMEYIAGATLRRELQAGPLARERAARFLRQIGSALDAAHAAGVCHRDLKPENVMLCDAGGSGEFARLIDFGIARLDETPEARTQTTLFAGTTPYMAPEHLRGKAGAASDVYALGVLAFEMAYGRRPFDADNPVELYELQRAGLKLRGVLGAALARELAFDPASRSATAGAAAESIASALVRGEHASPARAWTRREVLAGAVPVASAAAVWLLLDPALRPADRVVELPPTQEPAQAGFVERADIVWHIVSNSDGTGYEADRLITRDQGDYYRRLTRAQQHAAAREGWTIESDFLVEEGAILAALDAPALPARFSMHLARDPGGYDVVRLITGLSRTVQAREWAVPGSPGRRHNLALRWDPSTRTAALAVDGTRCLDGYAGFGDYRYGYGFQVGGTRYRSARGVGVMWRARVLIGRPA